MTEDWTAPAWVVLAAVAALIVLAWLVAGLLVRRRTRALLATVSTETTALREQVGALAQRLDEGDLERRTAERPGHGPVSATAEYVITEVGAHPPAPGEAPATLPAPLFADLVLRESVVQAASLAHGLRRALAPEARHRIRFQMRQEVKRSRRQRKAELRAARRLVAARERAAMAAEAGDPEARAAS